MRIRMMLKQVCLLLVAAFVCGCPAQRQVPETAGLGSGLHADAERAVEQCRAARQRAAAENGDGRYAVIADGCAGLFSLPLCEQSLLLSSRAEPGLRARMVSVACQNAYCQLIGAEGSLLCQMDLGRADDAEIVEAWGAFVPAVLDLELGVEPASPLGELLALAVGAELFAGPPTAAAVTAASNDDRLLTVRLERVDGEFRLGASLSDGREFGPWSLPLPPDEGDFSGLLEEAMREAASCPGSVEVDGDIDAAIVVHLLDALRSGGVNNVTLPQTLP